MKRISSPMFGGLLSLTLLTLVVIPVVYTMRERRRVIGNNDSVTAEVNNKEKAA